MRLRIGRSPSQDVDLFEVFLPAMADLEEAARYEIAWQKAMWDSDYAKAFEAARVVSHRDRLVAGGH